MITSHNNNTWYVFRMYSIFNGHEFEQTLGNSGGQRSLACCCPWGCKESDMTSWLNSNNKYQGTPLSTSHVFSFHLPVQWGIPILQVKELRLREVEQLAKHHRDSQWQGWEEQLVLPNFGNQWLSWEITPLSHDQSISTGSTKVKWVWASLATYLLQLQSSIGMPSS